MNMLRFSVVGISMLWSFSGHADWAVIGVATKCDPAKMTFEISPVLETSSVGSIPPKAGHTQLSNGNHELRCQFGKEVVKASIRVIPPRARGMCMGAGYVNIGRLYLDETPILSKGGSGTNFNFFCSGNRSLISITLRAQGTALLVEKCSAKMG